MRHHNYSPHHEDDAGRRSPFAVLPPLGDLLRRQRERTTAVEKATGRVIPYVFHRRGKPIRDYLRRGAEAVQ